MPHRTSTEIRQAMDIRRILDVLPAPSSSNDKKKTKSMYADLGAGSGLRFSEALKEAKRRAASRPSKQTQSEASAAKSAVVVGE
ncbi:MAG: hypothetical protein Q9195_009217 [Heterodermia aff. obscurata]